LASAAAPPPPPRRYSEYDKVLPTPATWPGPEGYPGRRSKERRAYRRQRPRLLAQRFARWHEDVFPADQPPHEPPPPPPQLQRDGDGAPLGIGSGA
jgi:hypothetical protein